MLGLVLALGVSCCQPDVRTVVWSPGSSSGFGDAPVRVFGSPTADTSESVPSIRFDGRFDGLVVDANPLAGLSRFTVEVLIRPDADGPAEPRFLHWQDSTGKRGLIELRNLSDGSWSLDTFLHDPSTGNRLTLLDQQHRHPAATWTWVALSYDGIVMRHFVNGREEMSGDVAIGLFSDGSTSIGMRLNHIHLYKGRISTILFHDAVPPTITLKTITP